MKIQSIILISFSVILSIGYGSEPASAYSTSSSDNSAIIALDSFYRRTMPDAPECVELQHGRMAMQNKTWCQVFVGRRVAGKIKWVKQIAPGDYWYVSKKDADDFCKGTLVK